MSRFGFVGPSYTARSNALAGEECINLYAESVESQGAIVPKKSYGGSGAQGVLNYIWTPGKSVFATFLQGPVRGSIWAENRLFVVSGGNFYEVFANGSWTVWGGVPFDNDSASIASNGIQLLIVGGGRAFCFTLATNVMLEITPQLAAIPSKVRFSDSFFIVCFQNSNKFQMSQVLDGTTWPGQLVNEPSVFSENITSIELNHRELWVFGSRHIQVYQDTGSAEVYDVIPGAFIELGCAATHCTALLDNSIFWISEDDRGARMAWRSNGYTPSRISTHAVEIDLLSYPTVAGMTTYSYQAGGHLFWVLYAPGSNWSWVYDVGEGLWHKRATWNPNTSQWGADLSWNHVYAFGRHLVGDWNSANLYTVSQTYFTDNGTAIRRLRRAPTIIDEMEWIKHKELTVDFMLGNLSEVIPSDLTGYVAGLLGPSHGGSAIDTPLGGTAWSSPGNVLTYGTYANSLLATLALTNASSISTGSNQGGGAPWANPTNIDSNSSFASVSLSAGGSQISPSQTTGSASNSASPSNQSPPPVQTVLSGFPSTVATGATVYVTLSGSAFRTPEAGVGMILSLSADGGATWKRIAVYNNSFSSTTIPITVTNITNLSSIQIQLEADCGCGPAGSASCTVTVSNWYAVTSGAGQPTAQTLVAAISGLTIPANTKISGLGVSFNADYSGTAPSFQIALNVGNVDPSFTLTTSPAIYTGGGATALWGYTNWSASTLANLTVSFYASSTGTTTVNVNTLIVTVYYVPLTISTDALDVTNFGFAPTATPQGITAAVLAYASVTGVNLTVQLLKAGVPTGFSQTLALGTNPTLLTFGGDTSLFGASFTTSDISNAGFGIRIIASTPGGSSANVFVGYTTLQPYCIASNQGQNFIGPPPVLLDGGGNPRPPQADFRWSDDRGNTWSNDNLVNCGFLGQYKFRARLQRLGQSRYRIYETSFTDPIPWVIVDAYLKTL